MKHNKKNLIKTLTILIAFVSFVSCSDFFSDDNANPNAPIDVPISGVLPGIQLSIIDAQGGMFTLFNNMFIQQVEGVERQWESFNKYEITPVRTNGVWNLIYENSLIDLRSISKKASDNGLNHYLAIAKTLEAYNIMMATDVFGDIPYTEAGLGDENLNPAYDDQLTVIYPAIKTLLLEALTLFNGPSGAVSPGSDDVLYGGSTANWKLAIHAILARYYLHLGDEANALAEAKISFGSRADNFGYTYPGGVNAAQWSGFNDNRQGDMEFHPTMRGIMSGLNDTDRLSKFDQTFNASHPYLVDNYQQDLITYREIQFIIAETSTNPTEKRTAYLNGIKASFEEAGFSGSTEYDNYVAQAAVDPGVGNITLNHVMTQKYIGLFVQPEAFSDWRRTGIPSLTPVAGSNVPRRWFYPENEYLFNSSTPARDADLLFKRVGWDN